MTFMNKRLSRREFLTGGLALLAGAGTLSFYKGRLRQRAIPGRIYGASSPVGHLLREGRLPPPSRTEAQGIVIVGGGVAGLSAAWKLKRAGFTDFTLFELESEVGGNSQSGVNRVSAYPWGAHYVPMPGPDAHAVRELFEELGVIEGYDARGLPRYHEEYLCAAPQERLYIHGRWQEELFPRVGSGSEDLRQYRHFIQVMQRFKNARGRDGRPPFSIPIAYSSHDPDYLRYDQLSMAQYMDQMGWNSKPLRWYVNYACRDDYGSTLETTSAWAALHYFAARTGEGAGVKEPVVLTWPEGNGWIIQQLKRRLQEQLRSRSLVFNIVPEGRLTAVDVYHPDEEKTTRILAEAVLYAAPKFTAPYTIAALRADPPAHFKQFQYAPWMVANLTLSAPPISRGAPLAWDNVLYDSPSLGYVAATHQSLRMVQREVVLTYYLPFCGSDPAAARSEMRERTHTAWTQMILADLGRAHPGLESQIENIDIWLWGHGMIRPSPGFLWGEARRAAGEPIGNIYFAHSDQSGLSIFEEAQYQGVKAAEALMKKFRHPFTSSL